MHVSLSDGRRWLPLCALQCAGEGAGRYILLFCISFYFKVYPYLTSEVPLLSREYSSGKPTVRSFYPPLFHQCTVLRVFKAT